MADNIVFFSLLISVMIQRICSADLIVLARSVARLKRLENMLSQIHVLLVDADHKDLTDRDVRLWMQNLSDVAYDLDDLLSDLGTEAATRHQLKKESSASTSNNKTSKVIRDAFADFTHNLMYGGKMRSKLDVIATKLDGLVDSADRIGLIKQPRILDVSAVVDASRFVGREGGKDVLLNTLGNPALRLSYYGLPPPLKLMLIYCSLFHKEYMFHKDELVLLWIAEGFLHQSDTKRSMESLGLQHFEELKSRSIFQHSTEGKSQYTMHGLFHDFTKILSRQFFITMDDGIGELDSNEDLERLRHFSFIRSPYGVYSKFKVLQRARGLRTFVAIPGSVGDCQNFYISDKVLVELLPKLRSLRVLSLSCYSIRVVPKSICKLKHIRYLNFSHTNIRCLPDQVCDLYNLQTLLLHGCKKLFNLPKNIAKLVNLRHLVIDDTPMLKKLPSGIGRLTSLQTLSKVIIEGSDGFKIPMFKGLLPLIGQLSIEGLHKVKNAREAEEANLQQKKGLDDLTMEWTDVFIDSRNKKYEYEVLEKLQPHDELRSLKILFYGGSRFPTWIGDPSFTRLTQLTLRGCENCTSLPTLGHLVSLQKLFVQSMNDVKAIGDELLGVNNSIGTAFPSLEILEFKSMEGWKEWTIDGGPYGIAAASSFPCLREISLVNCPNLVVRSTKSIPSVRVLHVENCSEEVLRSMVGMCPSIVRLTLDSIKKLTQLHGVVLGHLETMEYLRITRCHDLVYLWESEWEACDILMNLQKLEVGSCRELESLEKNKVNTGISLRCVREVTLFNCQKLKRYNCPKRIERLEIHRCRSITSLTFPTEHELPSTLKSLDIQHCDSLKDDWRLNKFLSSLESLVIIELPNLRTFPDGRFFHLTKIVIRGCDHLESIPEEGFGILPFCCLRYLEIICCMNLRYFPHKHLSSLTSLEELWISQCPNVDSFPCGLWPPNLRKLRIGGLKRPISTWGQQDFPLSLVNLCLIGENSGVVSFEKGEDTPRSRSNTTSSSFILPRTLTFLEIIGFKLLDSLSDGLLHLTNLQQLVIMLCPILKDLPETLLPSLSSLKVRHSKKLQERCRVKGDYWPLIAHIPEVDV